MSGFYYLGKNLMYCSRSMETWVFSSFIVFRTTLGKSLTDSIMAFSSIKWRLDRDVPGLKLCGPKFLDSFEFSELRIKKKKRNEFSECVQTLMEGEAPLIVAVGKSCREKAQGGFFWRFFWDYFRLSFIQWRCLRTV